MSSADKVIAAFRDWDPEHTGKIPSEHMRLVLKCIAMHMEDDVIADLIRGYGKEHDGLVEYADFFVWLMGTHWDLVPSSTRLDEVYQLDAKKLGEGAFGTVRKGTHRKSGAVRAIKTIKKNNSDAQKKDLDDEIAFMKQIDHPNIVRIYEVFEDSQFVHLAMELCAGGELLDKLIEELGFTEKQASILMHQVLSAVSHLHAFSICHRDLKPQNFLLKDAGVPVEQCVLKVADFGLSRSCEVGTMLTNPVGSPSYAAPEVLKGRYAHSCDLWSCGVITYVLLCARPPFTGKDDAEVLRKVMEGLWSFDETEWSNISKDARDFVVKLMTYDPSTRYTASQALNHPWILEFAPNSSGAALGQAHFDNMRQFCGTNRLKKAALHAVAHRLAPRDIQELKDIFNAADKTKDGLVTYEDLAGAVNKLGNGESAASIAKLVADVDTGRNGVINYTEFLAAAMDKRLYQEEMICHEVFQIFDRDRSGVISKAELLKVLCDPGDKVGKVQDIMGSVAISRVMRECDLNQDGVIDFSEFMTMMRS